MKYGTTYRLGDEGFEEALDYLEKAYASHRGDPDAEVLVNWNKREAKEDGVVSFYASNHQLSQAIKRGRKNIVEVQLMGKGDGAALAFKTKGVRGLYTVIRPAK